MAPTNRKKQETNRAAQDSELVMPHEEVDKIIELQNGLLYTFTTKSGNGNQSESKPVKPSKNNHNHPTD